MVAMPDAVLVAHGIARRMLSSRSRAKGAAQAETLPAIIAHGAGISVALGPRFKLNASLSIQEVHFRCSLTIIALSIGLWWRAQQVTIDDNVRIVTENQSVYIPLAPYTAWRNPSKLPLTLIEVQTGSYFGEDDITRYEDVYAQDRARRFAIFG